MRKVLIILLLAGLIIGGVFLVGKFIFSREKGKLAGLKVTSTPTASVFVDSKHLGRTPYEGKIEPGEFTLKLIPESTTQTVTSWQGKIRLSPGILTYVNRELGLSDLTSAGEVLTLEKIADKTSEIAIISNPDGAFVRLDGEEKGTTPLLLKNIPSGDHELTLSSPGFNSRSTKIKTTSGFKLNTTFQLALSSEEEATGAAETTPGVSPSPEKPYVKIKDTPTGWLRVRMGPTTASTEAAKVNPGQTFPFLDEEKGWFKIRYEQDKEGWVSGKYAEKIE